MAKQLVRLQMYLDRPAPSVYTSLFRFHAVLVKTCIDFLSVVTQLGFVRLRSLVELHWHLRLWVPSTESLALWSAWEHRQSME